MDNLSTSMKDEDRRSTLTSQPCLTRDGVKEAVSDRARIAQNNRKCRNPLQSYLRKRGVIVSFSAQA